MITKEQYERANKMLSVLDMTAHEEQYHKYLDMALDYEIYNGYFCSDFRLNNSLLSEYQRVIPRRSAGSIIIICEPLMRTNCV